MFRDENAKRWRAIGLGVGLFVLTTISLATIGIKSMPVSVGYDLEATFSSLPHDDLRLERWLKSVEGVVPHTVRVERDLNNPSKVNVFFVIVKDGWGAPPLPNLDEKCTEFGYGTSKHGFRNRVDKRKALRRR